MENDKMIKNIRLVEISKRDRECYFCGSNASVKYDAVLESGKSVPCCNKCVFIYYVVGDD